MLLVREAVRKYNVIIATCVGSGHEMFDDVTFERVIIDECAQSIGASMFAACSSEPTAQMPLAKSEHCLIWSFGLCICRTVQPDPPRSRLPFGGPHRRSQTTPTNNRITGS